MNYDSPADIRMALQRLGLRLQKRWGQNFLINRGARERIVELLAPESRETVWEVGPGLGSLTELLLPRVSVLVAFELDRGLVRYLSERFGAEPGFVLVQGDALKSWPVELERRGAPQRVAGNLPYASASALIGSFAEAPLECRRLVFTVQKELAERMAARPGTKAYSSFSVLCQVAFRIRPSLELRPGSFYPAPEVSSTVVVLEPRQQGPRDRRLFQRLVRGLFRSRRKTLWNNLLAAGLTGEEKASPAAARELGEVLRAAGIEPGARSETLSPSQFVDLADRLAAAFARPDSEASWGGR